MFSLSFPLAQGMPWLFALALLPAALLRGVWWPARNASGLGLILVLGAWLQAALDGAPDPWFEGEMARVDARQFIPIPTPITAV